MNTLVAVPRGYTTDTVVCYGIAPNALAVYERPISDRKWWQFWKPAHIRICTIQVPTHDRHWNQAETDSRRLAGAIRDWKASQGLGHTGDILDDAVDEHERRLTSQNTDYTTNR